MKKILKKLLIKSTAILCAAMVLFLSPCARYMGAVNMENVQATEIVIEEACDRIAEWLIALLVSCGLAEAIQHNRDALIASYKEYMQAQIDTEMFIIHSAEDMCIQVYDKATNTIKNISWQNLIDSFQDFHDTTVDDLTGIYIKYCPQLLESFDDFISSILDGDIYVTGISDAIVEYENITDEDIEAQQLGRLYTASFVTHTSYLYTNPYWSYPEFRAEERWFNVDLTYPIAAAYNTSLSPEGLISHNLCFYRYTGSWYVDSYLPSSYMNKWVDGIQTKKNSIPDTHLSWGLPGASTYSNNTFTLSGNIPIFPSSEAAKNYLKTGEGYKNALNYGNSIYDAIENTTDIPPFHKEWIQELLDKVSNAPGGLGIGSYGHGAYTDNWSDDIPWINLDSLHNYSLSLPGTYEQMLNDIVNGTYDSTKDIPGTYSDAWEQTLSDAWDNIVEQSSDAIPGESDTNTSTEVGNTEEPPEGDGDDNNNSNNEDNNNQEEPPKGGDDDTDITSDFDMDKLTRSQQRSVRTIQNIIEDHLTESDLAGALEELQGNPIEKPDGGFWNHVKEVKDAYTGLLRELQSLEGSLQNPNLDAEVRVFLQSIYDIANEYIHIIEEMLGPYGGIN